MTSGQHERGSTALETVIIAPGILLILVLLIYAGRLATADNTIEQAAVDAARAASLERSPNAAKTSARQTATMAIENQGLECLSSTIETDVSGFGAAPGQQGYVAVTVTCPVKVFDLPMLSLGNQTMTSTAHSPIDTYRER